MGCFGYLCSICEKQIVGNMHTGGEHCVLIHKRHDAEIGRTVGHYNEYGSVIEDALFRSDENNHPNSHSEISDSEMRLTDSPGQLRFLDGQTFRKSIAKSFYTQEYAMYANEGFYDYAAKEYGGKQNELVGVEKPKFVSSYDILSRWEEDDHEQKYQAFLDVLEDVEAHSGIIACHKYCYDQLSKEEQESLPFSKDDPNQSGGEINPVYA